MAFISLPALLCLSAALSSAARLPHRARQDSSDALSSNDAPDPNICGEIIDSVNRGYSLFWASDAYDCLASVPFNDAVALRFIDYYNTTMQFQSTLAYLKEPPEGYQQLAVDFAQGIQEIKDNVASGYYNNQYAFEADLQHLIYSLHDDHVSLSAGILSAFSFGSPWDIASASPDGKSLPQVYIQDDILESREEGWAPSPVVSINGEDVVEYLTRLAALNSVGMVEPHADWNQLMSGPAQDIQGYFNIFSGEATFYPGDDLNFTFANGSSLDTWWLAVYNNVEYTGPLTTAGDFYNYFVLGLLPASYDPDNTPAAFNLNTSATNSTEPDAKSWYETSSKAYPDDPVIVQKDLSIQGGGIITGYFLDDNSTGVLSIPSFNQIGRDVGNFSASISDFITQAQDAGIPRVIIDLQQNYGGQAELAFVTFKQFFPDLYPFAGSRRRSHELANVLGSAITGFWDSLSLEDESQQARKYQGIADEWVVTRRLNTETGKNFTSWSEYFGPRAYKGDNFSLTERYDLPNVMFDQAAFDGWIPSAYTEEYKSDAPQPTPWQPKDVVILTDGVCSSTCSLFVEMMTHDAGVRTVTVGGRPSTGPMQAASGNRGARSYSTDDLDSDFEHASEDSETAAAVLPNRSVESIYTSYAGFNLRDQVRANDTEPLQFKYLAADCRIYYTVTSVYNMTQLWQDAASAIWGDRSLCVTDSTGYAAAANGTASKRPPASTAPVAQLPALQYGVDLNKQEAGALPDSVKPAGRQTTTKICNPDQGTAACDGDGHCEAVPITCPGRRLGADPVSFLQSVCVTTCLANLCANKNDYCLPVDSNRQTTASTSGSSRRNPRTNFKIVWRGFCVPPGSAKLGC